MKEVWKFKLPYPCNYFELDAPKGTQWLHVSEQYDLPMIWGLVTRDAEVGKYAFRWAGTGHTIDDEILKHIGTYQSVGGNLIWHLFLVPLRRPEDSNA